MTDGNCVSQGAATDSRDGEVQAWRRGSWRNPELRRRLVGFARGLVGAGEAEDLVQEALVRAGQRRVPLRDARREEAWIFRVCHHAAIDHLRSRKVRKGVWAPMPADEGLSVQAVAAVQPGLDEPAAPAVQHLAAHQRLLVQLHYGQGVAQGRLCAATGLSPAALRVRLFRARRTLARSLTPTVTG